MGLPEFRRAMQEHDREQITAALAEDVVLHSPVSGRPITGRATVGPLLGEAREVLQDFTYTAELAGDGMTGLVFEATVGGKRATGVDLVVTGADGLVTEFTAMVRPLSAASAFNDEMGPRAADLLGHGRSSRSRRPRLADGPVAEASVHVDARPEIVWALVSDIHLIAESSEETQEVAWVDGDGPALGRRFRGRNVHPLAGENETVSHVIEYDPQRSFAWAVMDPDDPTATWRFTLAPDGAGTRLSQWARMGLGRSFLTEIIAERPESEEAVVEARLGQWRAGMERTLAHIKDRAEAR